MGKNYRNCNLSSLSQIPPPSILQEDPSKRKESTMNFNWSVSTVWKIREKYGDAISPCPNSERPPENSSLCNKKTQEDSSKVPPFSEECTDTVFWPTKSSSSITFWVWLWTRSWTGDFKLEFSTKDSKPSPFIRQESWSDKDTSESERTWSTLPLS